MLALDQREILWREGGADLSGGEAERTPDGPSKKVKQSMSGASHAISMSQVPSPSSGTLQTTGSATVELLLQSGTSTTTHPEPSVPIPNHLQVISPPWPGFTGARRSEATEKR